MEFKKLSLFYKYGARGALVLSIIYSIFILILTGGNYFGVALSFFTFLPLVLILLPFITTIFLLYGERKTKNKIIIPVLTNILVSPLLLILSTIVFGLIYLIVQLIWSIINHKI